MRSFILCASATAMPTGRGRGRRKAPRRESDDDSDADYDSAGALAPMMTYDDSDDIVVPRKSIAVRTTVPLIVATACVVVVALAAVLLQTWHVHSLALSLASVRVSATNVVQQVDAFMSATRKALDAIQEDTKNQEV